ncbi:MAG: hypothetical protein WA510_32040 [Acidobacteriaceae bacterium]
MSEPVGQARLHRSRWTTFASLPAAKPRDLDHWHGRARQGELPHCLPIEWAEVTDPAWKPAFTSADADLSKAFTGPCPAVRSPDLFLRSRPRLGSHIASIVI